MNITIFISTHTIVPTVRRYKLQTPIQFQTFSSVGDFSSPYQII